MVSDSSIDIDSPDSLVPGNIDIDIKAKPLIDSVDKLTALRGYDTCAQVIVHVLAYRYQSIVR